MFFYKTKCSLMAAPGAQPESDLEPVARQLVHCTLELPGVEFIRHAELSDTECL